MKRTPPPKPPNTNTYTTFSCQLCKEIDIDEMVACDACDKWFHFTCVNVTSDIANQDWKCGECQIVENIVPTSDQLITPLVEPGKLEDTPTSLTNVVQEKQKSVSNSKDDLDNPDKSSRKQDSRQTSIATRSHESSSSSIASRSHKSSSSKTTMSRKKSLALERLEEERKLLEQRDKEYLDRKYEIFMDSDKSEDDQVSKKSDFDQVSLNKSKFVEQWAKDLQNSKYPQSILPTVTEPNNVLLPMATSKEQPLDYPFDLMGLPIVENNQSKAPILQAIASNAQFNQPISQSIISIQESVATKVSPITGSTQTNASVVQSTKSIPQPNAPMIMQSKQMERKAITLASTLAQGHDQTWDMSASQQFGKRDGPYNLGYISNQPVFPMSQRDSKGQDVFRSFIPNQQMYSSRGEPYLTNKEPSSSNSQSLSSNYQSFMSNNHQFPSKNHLSGNPGILLSNTEPSNAQRSLSNNVFLPVLNNPQPSSTITQPLQSNSTTEACRMSGLSNRFDAMRMCNETAQSRDRDQPTKTMNSQSNASISAVGSISKSAEICTGYSDTWGRPDMFRTVNSGDAYGTKIPQYTQPSFDNRQINSKEYQPNSMSFQSSEINYQSNTQTQSTNAQTFKTSSFAYSIPEQPKSKSYYQPSTDTRPVTSYRQSNFHIDEGIDETSLNHGKRSPICHYHANQQPKHDAEMELNDKNHRSFVRKNDNEPSSKIKGDSSDSEDDEDEKILTRTQIAARHIVAKLPKFYGSPKEWPIFNSAFKSSTRRCGFSKSENLVRLRDSLQGEARDDVLSRLVHPRSVPAVMKTLEMMYGRPEMIIETMLDKIGKEPAPKENDLRALIKYAVSVQNIAETIQDTGAKEHLQNPSLMNAITDKLPTQIRLNWAYHKHSQGAVNLSSLGDWLFELASVASEVVRRPLVTKDSTKKDQKDNGKSNKNKHNNYVNTQVENTSKDKETKKCPACKNDSCSKIANCKRFKELPRLEKLNIVKENKLCSRCLGNHHFYRCRSTQVCGVEGCLLKHHSLLHNKDKSSDASTTVEKQETSKRNKQQTTSSTRNEGVTPKVCNSQRSEVSQRTDIFRIVPVMLFHNDKSILTHAYLDNGSNLTMMEEDLADELGVDGKAKTLCIDWAFGQTHENEKSKQISVQISGFFNQAPKYQLNNIRTAKELHLPSQSITSQLLDRYTHLKKLPVGTYESVKPRMLIGLQYSRLTVPLETVEGKWDEPIACRTRLGWVVQGPIYEQGRNENAPKFSVNLCICSSHDYQLHRLVKEYFALENLGVKITDKILESKEIQRSNQILEATTVKKNGRYETGLLWKFDQFELPKSYNMALKRLKCLETKMAKDAQLAEKLCNQFREFVDKNYIRKLSSEELKEDVPRCWYLPTFPVFNPKKPEKLRIVWDGAAKVGKVSLNSMLLTGPDMLVPLPFILRRFRERLIPVTGDIREMYHQVRIRQNDQNAQRFLWRDGDQSRTPDVYIMQVMIFGSTCAPSTAQYVKNKNALEYKEKFPRAVEAIINNHYVDDMIECAHTIEEAVELVKNVKYIHSNAGFEIRNFVSSSKELLKKIGENVYQPKKDLNVSIELGTERVLGMFWQTDTDRFTFSLKFTKVNENILDGSHCPTKREVLRILMSVFDPLGLLANFLVYAKILLQEIWRSNIDWDEKLTPTLQIKWTKWVQALPNVESIQIPRLYSPKISPKLPKSIQLHTFVDGSLEAYAAVSYFRIEDEDGVECSLAGAKTKVAPNKPISVPRLELQAAVLGVRLSDSIKNSHTLKIDKHVFWSDSKSVLGWIASDSRWYNQFVAFRIGEVLETTEACQWRWVPTEHNVADEATKSKVVPEIYSTSRWFIAPKFLYEEETTWFTEDLEFTTEEELRPSFAMACMETQKQRIWNIKPERFSQWNRLVHAQAYVFRVFHNAKRDTERRTGALLQEEIVKAENQLYRQAQNDNFLDEILIIEHNKKIESMNQKSFDKSSQLFKCSPYLDDQGVIRVGGRIDAAECLSPATKRPIILPRHHRITKLIVDHYHRRYKHINHQTALNEIKQKYEIPALRVVLKTIRSSCQKCKNLSAEPNFPEMAELPAARLSAFTFPFTFVGVDYFGPYKVKVKRSLESRYGVIFTCLTTRAIHLEVAHSLNTSSCITTIRNFMGRRGQPREFYSDNGTQFHGTDNELAAEYKKMNQDELQKEFTTPEMMWKFNPPASAHMGGIWERLIRTVKSCLKQMMTTKTPTDEMLTNLFIEIESIVNSRPLTYVPLDSADDESLTPNHFLLGHSSGLKPIGVFTPKDLLRNNWRAIQQMTNHFWRRFVLEYMPTLTKRTKWFKQTEPIKVGDIVLIIDERNDRNTWPKGIVEEVFVGIGGKRRQAIVKTATATITGTDAKTGRPILNTKMKTYKRSVHKLAVLDVKVPTDKQEVKLNPSESANGGQNVGQH